MPVTQQSTNLPEERLTPISRDSREWEKIRNQIKPHLPTLVPPEGITLDALWVALVECMLRGKRHRRWTVEKSLSLNDVAEVARWMRFPITGMKQPYLEWVPEGTEVVMPRTK